MQAPYMAVPSKPILGGLSPHFFVGGTCAPHLSYNLIQKGSIFIAKLGLFCYCNHIQDKVWVIQAEEKINLQVLGVIGGQPTMYGWTLKPQKKFLTIMVYNFVLKIEYDWTNTFYKDVYMPYLVKWIWN